MCNTPYPHIKLFFLLAACVLAGCGQEKESLHEHEHDAPEHWPSDMAEAAEFIMQRVELLSGASTQPLEDAELAKDTSSLKETEEELRDLVEWAPEVAADTDLPEVDWVPVYEMSEVIRKHLQSGDVTAADLSGDLKKLAKLLEEAHAKLPPDTKI
jgi:DNA repair ATPase RecN